MLLSPFSYTAPIVILITGNLLQRLQFSSF